MFLLPNIYVNDFFQVSFFFAQQPIWCCYNSAINNQLEHTIAHNTLGGAQAQMTIFVDCKSCHSAKISSQILGESQEVQLGSVVTQYVLLFQ
jgi:hypothetical protein